MYDSSQDLQNRELASQRLSREGRKFFKFIEFDANEELVSEIRKHPFGLFLVFLTGALIGLVILAISALAVSTDVDSFLGSGNLNSLRGIFAVIAMLLIFGVVVATLIAAFLYRSNVIYVTSEKLAQVIYVSLFNRKISQLSIGDVQDVTVAQKGILAHLFNYGTLIVETAGEQQNYTFTYVPDPYRQSQLIVGAHERNLVAHGN